MEEGKITLPKKDSFDFNEFAVAEQKSKQWITDSAALDTLARQVNRSCTTCFTALTSQTCPDCNLTAYCSQKCWREDQPTHSKICGKQAGFYMPKEVGTEFPHLVFAKNFSKGSVVFTEDPLVRLPVLPTEYEKDDGKGVHQLVCFTCHETFYPRLRWAQKNNEVDLDSLPECSDCGLFKCSKNCPDDYHRRYECKVLQNVIGRNFKSYLVSKRRFSELYLDICLLRLLCVLSKNHVYAKRATTWRKFMLLPSTSRFKAFKKKTKDYYDGMPYMKILKRSVEALEFSLAYARGNREIVLQIFKTMIVFWEEFEVHPGIVSRILYLNRHFMAHSYCSPNIAVSLQRHGVGSYPNCYPNCWYYVTEDISIGKKGPVKLTFDFSPRRFMPICLRMMYFNEIGLRCENSDCVLCDDPSDGGSHSGSIRCKETNCNGLYVEHEARKNPKMISNSLELPKRWSPKYVESVDWKCNKCNHTKPFSEILDVLIKFEEMYKSQVVKPMEVSMLIGPVEFLNVYENSYLHSTNGLILQAKYDYLWAAREYHFKRCMCDRHGFPLEIAYRHILYSLKRMPLPRVKLFVQQWDRNELAMMRRKVQYARDCVNYLEMTIHGKDFVDCTFLKLVKVLAELISTCFDWITTLTRESETEFYNAAWATVDAIEEWQKRKDSVFQALKELQSQTYLMDSRLKWPPELDTFSNQLSKCEDLKQFMKQILLFMGLTLEEFVTVDGVSCVEFVKEEGLNKWPFDQGTSF